MLNFKSVVIGLVTSLFAVSGALALDIDCRNGEHVRFSYQLESLEAPLRMTGTSCGKYELHLLVLGDKAAIFHSNTELTKFVNFIKDIKRLHITPEQLAAVIALNGLSPDNVAVVQRLLTPDIMEQFAAPALNFEWLK